MPLRLHLLVLLSCALFACGGRSSSPDPPLTIAAASSLRPIVDQLQKRYTSLHGGETIRCVYGASGMLHTQLRGGAPFNIFLTADPKYLVDLGKGQEIPIDTLAWGRLGFLSKFNSVAACATLIVPQPATAPYGKAAEIYLEEIQFKSTIRFSSNAAQVVHQITNGWGDGGLTSWSLIHNMEHARAVENGPRVPIAMGATYAHPENERFIEFLAAEENKAIWLEHAYQME